MKILSLASLQALIYSRMANALSSKRLLGSSFGIPGDDDAFDYIVVGGGTAGLTIATRLAEYQTGTVAVVEAGTFYEISNGNISQIPALDGAFTGKGKDDWHPLIDWGYSTTPQAGAYHTEIHYPRGKCLGGSSARNYMVYQRGTISSYQKWADTVGDQSYSFEHFLPYFKKSIRFYPPDMTKRSENGTPQYDLETIGNDDEGYLSVTFPNYVQAFGTWAQRGLAEIGISPTPGFLSGALLGQSYSMFTIDGETMVRDSSATAFLPKALLRTNFRVYPSTTAKRIRLDEWGKATGVVVDTGGREYTLSARKEIVLSAGVIGSPHLLMLSGIGPASQLRPLGIPVIADRPGVGQNFRDHIYFALTHRVNAPTLSSLNDPRTARLAGIMFNEHASGLFTNPTTDVLAWEKLPAELMQTMENDTIAYLKEYPDDWPDLEYISLGAYVGNQTESRKSDPRDGFNYAALAVALCTPRSVGSITISSSDIRDPPLIDPNFLSEKADIEVAIAGFKRARQFWSSDSMRSFSIGDEIYPGLEVTSAEQIEDMIRHSFNTVYHGACTCAMGKISDPMAVVDSQARVIGVQNLRVVDASAFPLLPPGHPQATVYALAEKIARTMTRG